MPQDVRTLYIIRKFLLDWTQKNGQMYNSRTDVKISFPLTIKQINDLAFFFSTL